MTPSETGAVMRLIFASWPTQRMRMAPDDIAAMTTSYIAGLGDLEAGQVRDAIIRLARLSEWIPTIAAIRKAVGIVVIGTQKSGMEAWGEVHDAQAKYGSHRCPKSRRSPNGDFAFADPITAQVVSAIGWLEICQSTTPDHIRARFIDAYDHIAESQRDAMAASPGANSNALLEHRPNPLLAKRVEESAPVGDLIKSLMPSPRDERDTPCEHDGSACPWRCHCTCYLCVESIRELARKFVGDQ